MIGGADSIDDMDLLRHGAMPALFGGVRAPSTLGSFLRSFTWGNVLQLEKVSRVLLAELARRAPLLPGKDTARRSWTSTRMQKRVYGHKKQGAAFGHTKIQGKSLLVRGLNALAATISTPLAAPVIAAHPAARRQRGLRPRRRRRSPPRRSALPALPGAPGRWWRGPTRRSTRAAFTGAVRRGRGVLLGHRADGPARQGGDRGHRRGRLDPHQIPPRDLG